MKKLDVIVAILLVIGGINWGLVGLARFDLVAAVFGEGSAISNAVYGVVGAAALYQLIGLRWIQRRWGVKDPIGQLKGNAHG